MDRLVLTVAAPLALVLLVWCELALVQSALPSCAGIAASFAGAWVLIARARGAPPADRSDSRSTAFELASFALAGLILQPWLGLVAVEVFEIANGRAAVLARGHGLCGWCLCSSLLLAPIFEERLYRERLQPALQRSLGSPLAIVASAACFALPHVTPLRVLGTFLAGLVLGLVWHATQRVAPCAAMHAGFNAAALWQRAAMGDG